MKRRHQNAGRIAVLVVLGILVSTGPAWGQARNGDIHALVSAGTGEPLPGVTVELQGGGAPGVRTTDDRGEIRFVGLAPGTYRLEASLDGFSTLVLEDVEVRVGHATDVRLAMLSALEEEITVDARAPVLDERRLTAGASVSHTELDRVPSARDPWVVVQTVPGVLTSGVNVGGNKSGNQQAFSGGGVAWDNTWSIDGVVVTDMAYSGSPTYHDFGSFQEVQVSTGGTDIQRSGAGVVVNLVTKRGTDAWRGAARYLVADDAWQDDLEIGASEFGEGQEAFAQGDRIDRIGERGAEGGGPLVEERLWIWGHYSQNEIDLRTIFDYPNRTDFEHYGVKLNGQIAPSTSAIGFYQSSAKTVDGRGASPSRPPPTTWNQQGQTEIFKLEASSVITPGALLTGFVSLVDQGFSFMPKGGIEGRNATLDENFSWQHNFFVYGSDRPQRQATVEGDFFFSGGKTSHELEIAGGYREQETDETIRWPGDVYCLDFYRSFGFPFNVAVVTRPEVYAYASDYLRASVQDTLRRHRLTLNLGLRYDRQQSRLGRSSVPGVEGFEALPDGTPLMPAVSFEGRDLDFTWEDIQPRMGITYALGAERRTLLRTSYSRYAEQLFQFEAQLSTPVGTAEAHFFYQDSDGDRRVSVDEIVGFEAGPFDTNGYDPFGQIPAFDIDPRYDSPLTDEVILAAEHAFLPDLVAGLSATWRRGHRYYEEEQLVSEDGLVRAHRRDDYELRDVLAVSRPDGSTIDVPVWGLREGVSDTGRVFVTSGDRETDYLGLSLTLNKRLSDRWMARGHVSWSDWTQDIPDSERENPNLGPEGYKDDGGPVLMGPITPGWSYRLGGLVQIAPDKGWGFDLSGNLWGRQGYAIPYSATAIVDQKQVRLQATTDVDEFRQPDLHLLELGVQKRFDFGDTSVTLGVDCFNVFNESTVLARNSRLGTGTTDHVEEVTSPRVFRLSLRLSYR